MEHRCKGDNSGMMKYAEKNLATLFHHKSNYVFLSLCLRILIVIYVLFYVFRSYCVGSVNCLCVNIYFTTATVCQPNCSLLIYRIIIRTGLD